jgi:hypothetical protein
MQKQSQTQQKKLRQSFQPIDKEKFTGRIRISS